MNKRYRRHITVEIQCSDQQLPTAMQQIGDFMNIESSGPQITFGNVPQVQQVPQIQQVKNVELLPPVSLHNEVPTLANGRRIPRG